MATRRAPVAGTRVGVALNPATGERTMREIVECVPNFSEGKDRAKIDAIVEAIAGTSGVSVLDVDPGAETNRTVVTFVGPPHAVLEGAFRGIQRAGELIDMRSHHGAHARLGATDVCPFIPVSGVTMEDCVALARALGERVGSMLGIPVYLYEAAATRPERKNLAEVRAGEYESLPSREGDAFWKPDFGPDRFPMRHGATVIGARPFLIAYNINLNTRSKKLAHDIALDLREKGRQRRAADGTVLRDSQGNPVLAPGRLRECKAVGWSIPEYGAAQISINLTDFHVTSLHDAFDAASEEAQVRGLRVTGSEIVGLVPLEALRRAGAHYLRKQGAFVGAPDAELVHVGVKSLGLSEITPFEADKKIVERRLEVADRLVLRTVTGFVDELSSDSPAPGGGSVAALLGGLSAALSAMVAALTHGKKGYEATTDELGALGVEAQAQKLRFLDAVDRDTQAFNAVMAAMKLPKKTIEEQEKRSRDIEAATREATLVPLGVLEETGRAAELALVVAEKGNRNSLSDAGVAALCAESAAHGAYYNVLINLAGKAEDAWAGDVLRRAEVARARTVEMARRVMENVESRLKRELTPSA